MYFKDIKPGYPIYIFNRDDITVEQTKVLNVSTPHFDSKNYTVGTKMVVDVTVGTETSSKTYTLKEDTDTGYTDTLVITTDKSNIVREIEMAKAQSEEILSQVDAHKDKVQKYTHILAEFNPAVKEKQEIDRRFGKLENSIDEIKSMLLNINRHDVPNC